ncbi:tetratricopeptide repeat protein [Nocardia lijiangensis]|uniref:tetratricopeptide repeat protein n=1 Tax=Nocardia lijiangensis TaxID=299618 RepID=UPI0008318B54|nr:tetratricopeptide repeat protein [Nocardia lijiangensis]
MSTVWEAVRRAHTARDLDRPAEARRILGAALAVTPDDPLLLAELADIDYRLNDYAAALRGAQAAIAADPDRVDAYLTAALVHHRNNEQDEALRLARTAVRIAPHSVSALLTLAQIIAGRSNTDELRAEARAALRSACAYAPQNADVLAHAAESYRKLPDLAEARRHVERGLAENPLHVELLETRARLEFGDFSTRDKAVATLRGLLGASPNHAPARRLLAEIMWRALLRLAVWVWFFAVAVVTLSMWVGPGVLRVATPLLFIVVLVAWVRVFRALRRQLPPRYLRTRLLRRPEALLGLCALVFASLFADLGAVMLRTSLVGAGYALLIVGVFGASMAHLLLFAAWLRRYHGETDRDAAEDYALFSVIAVVCFGFGVLGVLGALRWWSREPAAFPVVAALLGMVVVTLLLELLLVFALGPRNWGRPVTYCATLLTLLALAVLGTRWSFLRMAAETFTGAS